LIFSKCAKSQHSIFVQNGENSNFILTYLEFYNIINIKQNSTLIFNALKINREVYFIEHWC